ncbi:hypothetical protein PS2_019631 [Malus domestica]
MANPPTSPKENRALFDAQQIAEMFRAFQASTNADLRTNEERVHDREMSYLDHFMKNKLLKFWGAPEAEKAESWLEHIKKKMRSLHVPPEFHVNLASHVFEGEADLWWGTIRA